MKKQSELYPLLDTLKRLGLEATRENYLAIDRWGNPDPLTGEEEVELPPQFRRPVEPESELEPEPEITQEEMSKQAQDRVEELRKSGRLPSLDQVLRDVKDLVEPEDLQRKGVKPTTRLTPQEWGQALRELRAANWPRCRCEFDDLFDMCLNCITHRQANDLVN